MPAEFWSEATRMTTSGLLVAVVAVPVGLLAWATRPRNEPLLPRWKPWRAPWSGFEVALAFIVMTMAGPLLVSQILTASGFFLMVYGPGFPTVGAKDVNPELVQEASTLRLLWSQLFALPIVLFLLWIAARTLYPRWKPSIAGNGSIAGKVWLAVLAWLAIAPIVLILNGIVHVISLSLNVRPEEHALTTLGHRPLMDQVLFVLGASLLAPLNEELFFRGILLSWCIGRTRLFETGVSPSTETRPWYVMIAAIVLAALIGGKQIGPVIFAVLLAVGLGALWRYTRVGKRRVRAVYATAALFAVVHSNVWPSPIPLFLLGLGLGWLAARTNGILTTVIVHGLFNAISVIFVLRGGAG